MTIDVYCKDEFISYSSLIKYSYGFFKSEKQAKFISKSNSMRSDVDFLLSNFGIVVGKPTNKVVTLSGTNSFAEYGSRGKIPYVVAFEFDEYGIVAKYKIGGNGNLRDGWSPNPKKCKKEWSRDLNAPLPEWATEMIERIAEEKRNPAPEYVKIPCVGGNDQKIIGKIIGKKWHGASYSYNSYSESLKVLIEEDRGFKVWGTLPSKLLDELGGEENVIGSRIEFVANCTPKIDDEYFGFFSRPKKAKVRTDSAPEKVIVTKEMVEAKKEETREMDLLEFMRRKKYEKDFKNEIGPIAA